jgi:hypothetical protein
MIWCIRTVHFHVFNNNSKFGQYVKDNKRRRKQKGPSAVQLLPVCSPVSVRLLCSAAPSGQQPLAGQEGHHAAEWGRAPGRPLLGSGRQWAGSQRPANGGEVACRAQIGGQRGRAGEGQQRATARSWARRRSGERHDSWMRARRQAEVSGATQDSALPYSLALDVVVCWAGRKKLKTCYLITWATTRAMAQVALVLGPSLLSWLYSLQ